MAFLRPVQLPVADPGDPDTRSPARLLIWVGRQQRGTLLAGVLFGVLWMVAQALIPFAIGRAIQLGIVESDNHALAVWTLIVLGLGATQAAAGVMRHRFAVFNWLQASFRMAQIVAHHVARSGPAVRAELSTGEVVATVSNDAMRAGGAFEVTARLAGAIVAYIVVAFILLVSSVTLGLVVLVGVPVLVALLAFVIKPLQARQREQREEVGKLTALGADTAAGLRVLRGIGGEQAFFDRYKPRSQEVRRRRRTGRAPAVDARRSPGVHPGALRRRSSPGSGARFAVEGKIEIGELIAFYGYAAFLVIPLRTAAEAVDKIDALARRRAPDADRARGRAPRRRPRIARGRAARRRALADPRSELVVQPGELVCLVSADPAETSAIADRLGRFGDEDGVLLGDVRLADLPVETVRRRIVVSEADPMLFAGTLRHELDPLGPRERARRAGSAEAIGVANAEDMLEPLPEGLDAAVEERGRSFSGGQRQRLVLARALLSDAETLVLVEPTSAVDAHTEARIAERLREARSAGRP